MKPVALSGTRGHVPGLPFMDTKTAMQRVGNNCGNLVFQYAACSIISDKINLIGQDVPWQPNQIKAEHKAVVIPSANFLRENFDLSSYVSFLEKCDLPLVFLGLGAQADDFSKDSFDFHSSILRLLDLMRERSPKISIRGEFTAKVLEKYRVENYEITGCPSNFINPSPDLGSMIARKLTSPMRSFIAHADEPWPKNPTKGQAERKLASWAANGPGIMVQQAVPEMIAFLRQNNPFAVDRKAESFEISLAKAILPEADLDTFRDFIATKMRTYFCVDQWLEDSSHFDFSVGLRLHGNMAAWQAGTPALWITHDSRTKELSETMALPNIGIEDFLEKCETVEDAWKWIEFDSSAYERRRHDLYSKMSLVASASGISIRESN
ncbi:polysaccharide pyruvyl transferase family protein [Nioella ostreopsis]|uniref:polysaccharide pyruvyl transferase family protein n=1 Tax=Nioella ostreopsis TaxID=2448479 RepID=UPI000FD88B21|nr:polysaccharide pyruvyl transferase family protein [Nioella ostreopsis]